MKCLRQCLQEKEEEIFPVVLRQFLNQKYTVVLEIKEENIKNGSKVYEAKEIVEVMDLSDSCDRNEDIIVQTENISNMKVSHQSIASQVQ